MRHEVLLRTSDGRRSIIIDDDFCQSLGEPVGSNKQSVALFVSSWISLLADSPLNPEMKPFKLYKRFVDNIRLKGIKRIVLEFSDLAHKLVSQHTLMGSGTSIGSWIDDFKDTPVFFEYNRYYKTGDVSLIRFLYTFLNFGKKLDYVDESFNSVAFRNWSDIEDRLGDLVLDKTDTTSLRRILSCLLPPFSWSDLRPKFGPGSVQERGIHGRIDKLRNLRYDPVIDRFLLHGHIGMYGYGADHGIQARKIIPDPSAWTPARGVSSRIARLMFVPKNLKTARSICMEPNTLMFFQQSIMRRFLELIGSSSMSNFIDIEDQSRNQELCFHGSYTSEIDTLDLSAASDSLSLDLVRSVFPPSWQIPMIASRSHSAILPDGTIRSLKKFAPMGSALCFPTQCIIFASVCIYAACLYTYEVENVDIDFLDWLTDNTIEVVVSRFSRYFKGYSRYQFQPLAVYGDDICVDGRLTDTVKSILSRLGFTVNDSKSFCGSQSFRESCGKFYLDGNDITPLYFRVKGVKAKLTSSHVVSQVHLINECRIRQYRSLYRFLHNSLITWGCLRRFRNKVSKKNSIPYVSDPNTFGIYVPEPKNSHLEHREHPDYQRTEIRCWTISYTHIIEPGDLLPVVDAYEYMRWWANRDERSTTEESSSVARHDTGCPGLRWRWIPAE